MKTGTFIIFERDGKLIAAVRRADNVVIELEIVVTPDLQKLDGQPCEYLLKGDKIVNIGGRNIFQQQRVETQKVEQSKKIIPIDLKRQMRTPIQDEPKIIEDLQKPAWSQTDSFQLQKARVPTDTKSVSIGGNQVDNFSLKLNQFARFEEVFNDRRNEWDRKFHFFKGKDFQIQPNFGKLFDAPTQLADRQKAAAQVLFPANENLLCAKFQPEWRFVTGLGGHSVYETGLTLHHIYGVPYIPASSIKGVLRSWVIAQKFENNEGVAIGDEMFCTVFGCPADLGERVKKTRDKSMFEKARQGKITFFDALPTESPTIEPDIMNPHYSKWYGGNGAPVDTDSPIPVFFLTVTKTPFQFLMGSKTWNLETQLFWDGQTLGWWLQNALSEHGIGAKTAVGYGYMKSV